MASITFKDGRVVQFDDCDAELVNATAWCPNQRLGNGQSAYATGWIPSLKRNGYMHRVLARAQAGQVVDHINGDTLDNRRSNLRLCTQVQNNGNSRHPVGRSGYRGVSLSASRGVWQARITIKNKSKKLGVRDTPAEAALLYDAAARAHFGEFATLNFPGA